MVMAQDSSHRMEKGGYSRFYLWATGEESPAVTELEAFADEAFGEAPPVPGAVDPGTAAALEALGYLSSPSSADLSAAPDPRERTGILSELHRAEGLPPGEAVQALQALLVREPGLARARLSLSIALSAAGRPADALAACQELLERQPSNQQALNNASVLARQLGSLELCLVPECSRAERGHGGGTRRDHHRAPRAVRLRGGAGEPLQLQVAGCAATLSPSFCVRRGMRGLRWSPKAPPQCLPPRPPPVRLPCLMYLGARAGQS